MAWFGNRSTSVRLGAASMVAAGVAIAVAPGAAAQDAAGAVPAFLLRDGRQTAFEAPEPGVALHPSGINDRGEVTGEYIRDDGESGFVRSRSGRITTFDVPGARGTEAAKINDRGQVVGRYSEDTPLVDDSSRVRGFVRRGDRVTRIDFPRARHTLPTGINDRGDVVGYYVDRRGATHGFLWRDRRFTSLDLVGARSPMPVDVNDRGDVVGLYLDDAGAARGFLLSGNRYTTISVPGASGTTPTGIDDRGRIVGYTADDLELTGARGFRRAPGTPAEYQAVEVPGGGRSLPLGTNDRGDVVGLSEAGSDAGADGGSDAGDDPPPDPDAAEQWPGMSGGPQLETVRGITVDASIADELAALLAAAEADGFRLAGGGYRDNAQQIALRRMNCGTSYYAIYEMPSSQCTPPTARPGTSMHERGLAIDFTCNGSLVDSRSDPCFAWLADNAETYGLYNLPSEPWHWSVNGR